MRDLGDEYVSTEHLLLALAAQDGARARRCRRGRHAGHPAPAITEVRGRTA